MKCWSRVFCVFLATIILLPVSAVFADEDVPDYRLVVNPGYQISGESYGMFETPVYNLAAGLDSLLISVDYGKSPKAVIRGYARFKYEKTGQWSHYKEFDCEFQFADLLTVSAYQMMFIIRDDSLGTNKIKRFTVQGKKVGEEIMQKILQKPLPFIASVTWPKPVIVSREGWKARPPKGEYNYHEPRKIVIHHSWAPTQAQYAGSATIRGIQNYHMDDEATGWIDIGHHFLIGPDGIIYQGRPETAVGAHCPPNTTLVGICIIGNYDPNNDLPNEQIDRSLIDLLSWLSSTYSIDPKQFYYGHRNFSPKSCPGDLLYDKLPLYREAVLKNLEQQK